MILGNTAFVRCCLYFIKKHGAAAKKCSSSRFAIPAESVWWYDPYSLNAGLSSWNTASSRNKSEIHQIAASATRV